jgi:hypothetical protein
MYDVNDINFDEGTMELTCGKCKSKIKAFFFLRLLWLKEVRKSRRHSKEEKKWMNCFKNITGSIADFSKFVDELQKSIGDKDTELATVKEQLSAKSTE